MVVDKGREHRIPHRLHIFGASGSGTSTLGRALARRLALRHLDADDYYWQKTDPPYVTKSPVEVRLRRLRADLNEAEGWVLSGSVVSWADALIPRFTAAVFVTLPEEVRLQRLRLREIDRYGSRIEPGGDMHEASKAFLDWAARYDAAGPEIRSRELHERWISRLQCPVVRVESSVPLQDLVNLVLQHVEVHNVR